MDRGILYVATGEGFVEEARVSARTVRSQMGHLPVAIATDQETAAAEFNEVILLNEPTYSFKDKILGLERTPFDKTVFLDTDTFVREPIGELFELLEEFDIAATHNQNGDMYTNKSLGVPESFPEYSSGVIGYNIGDAIGFLESWLDLYSDDHLGDQPSFRRVLYEGDHRIATLPREYNYAPRYPAHIRKGIKVFHGRLLEFNPPGGAGREVNIRALVRDYSPQTGHQLYDEGGLRIVPAQSSVRKFQRSLTHRGVVRTLYDTIRVVKDRVSKSGKRTE